MTTSSFLQETQPTLTLKDVVLSRQNSFLSRQLRIFVKVFLVEKWTNSSVGPWDTIYTFLVCQWGIWMMGLYNMEDDVVDHV